MIDRALKYNEDIINDELVSVQSCWKSGHSNIIHANIGILDPVTNLTLWNQCEIGKEVEFTYVVKEHAARSKERQCFNRTFITENIQLIRKLLSSLMPGKASKKALAFFKIEGVEINVDRTGLITAKGPVGTQQYKPWQPRDNDKEIPRDGYYVSDYHSEYDIALLRDRIIGDVVQPIPEFPTGGHAVEVPEGTEWVFDYANRGRFAVINGTVNRRLKEEARFTFNYSAFRGPGARFSTDLTPFVMCSGGPTPTGDPASELTYSGRYEEIKFWRWRESAKGDGGEYYTLKVPVWIWQPSNNND